MWGYVYIHTQVQRWGHVYGEQAREPDAHAHVTCYVLRAACYVLRATCMQVGPNKRGKTIVQLSLSSKPKPVGATIHPVAGIPEFVSTLLSTLDPADALTFLKHEGLLSKVLGKRRCTEADAEAEAE